MGIGCLWGYGGDLCYGGVASTKGWGSIGSSPQCHGGLQCYVGGIGCAGCLVQAVG